MNNNRSFVVTLLLAVGSGAMIGLLAFGMTGRNSQPDPAAANVAVPPPSAPSPAPGGDEPMAPVQYDSPDDSGGAPPPAHDASAPRSRPVLM